MVGEMTLKFPVLFLTQIFLCRLPLDLLIGSDVACDSGVIVWLNVLTEAVVRQHKMKNSLCRVRHVICSSVELMVRNVLNVMEKKLTRHVALHRLTAGHTHFIIDRGKQFESSDVCMFTYW